VLVGKYRKEKYVLSLELVKVGGYDFPHPYDGPWNSHLISKWTSIDTEIYIPDIW
jgi:hypothetical protein